MSIATGQTVRVTYEGRTVAARVVLASSNGQSLMLSFDASLSGPKGMYIGMMPVLLEDGAYRDLMMEKPVLIQEVQP